MPGSGFLNCTTSMLYSSECLKLGHNNRGALHWRVDKGWLDGIRQLVYGEKDDDKC